MFCVIVMELAVHSFSTVLQKVSDLDLAQRQSLMLIFLQQIIKGLNYLHGLEGGAIVIHRDMKPDNILVFKKGEKYVLKICDFGVSKLLESDTNTKTIGYGTQFYADPVMCLDRTQSVRYGREIDYFSIGVIFYIMLEGRFPWLTSDEWKQFTFS